MEGKAKLMLAIIGAAIIISAGICYFKTAGVDVPENLKCAQDSDCAPASCCHASSAVNKQFAPDCKGIKCTMECASNTLDCGQGEIKCVNKACKVVMR